MKATQRLLMICSLLIASAAFCSKAEDSAAKPLEQSVNSAPVLSGSAKDPATGSGQEQRMSIDYPSTDMRKILRDIADRYDLNVVIPEGLRGKTSIMLHDVTWQQAFEVILTPIGYDFRTENGIVKVFAKEGHPGRADVNESDVSVLALLGGLYALLWIPVAVLHLLLAIGVWRDKLTAEAWPFPRLIWGFEVLAFGLLGLLAYWLIHHSRLAKRSLDSG